MKISTILDHIDTGHMALPEFQRGYVWNRTQVRGLMESLYRGHPVGSLLVWATDASDAAVRGDQGPAPGVVKLLLDGQQRITSLYGIVRGHPPKFFDGYKGAFLNLYFHLEDESFEFYGPVKMGQDPKWISVTKIMQDGLDALPSEMYGDDRFKTYAKHINDIYMIQQREFHIDEVTGQDKTVEVVVDIFNRVNSGGTKLSKGDLALAKICADWPDARSEMRARLRKWRESGFYFKLDWLLRIMNAILTGEARFTALENVSPNDLQRGLKRAEASVDHLLNLVGSRLGLDHNRVLGSRYSFPLLARYVNERGSTNLAAQELDHLLYWYIHTMLWGRYAGSTESKLNQDLEAIESPDDGVTGLIDILRRARAGLRLRPDDFIGWSRGARFYPFLYMLTRVSRSRDWCSEIELNAALLGKLSSLQLHHIFPKAKLYRADKYGASAKYTRPQVNALANFTFLTQECNLKISASDPAKYLAEIAERDPSLLEEHWIPMDPDLWEIPRYLDFLEARRALLAKAGNQLLNNLLHGKVVALDAAPEGIAADATREVLVPGGIETDEELQVLIDLNDWVVERGLADGELEYELADDESGDPLAVLDLAWPDGLQPGLTQPLALLLDEALDTEKAANAVGFLFFTEAAELRRHVEKLELGTVPGD